VCVCICACVCVCVCALVPPLETSHAPAHSSIQKTTRAREGIAIVSFIGLFCKRDLFFHISLESQESTRGQCSTSREPQIPIEIHQREISKIKERYSKSKRDIQHNKREIDYIKRENAYVKNDLKKALHCNSHSG